jgi:polysaccharide biosynthesis protein PelF
VTTTRQRVLLVTEGTYPFYWGGLSTWCHSLIRELPEIDFSLIAVAASSTADVLFEMPANVVEFRPTPLWGVRNAWELDRCRPLTNVRARRRRTTDDAVSRHFLPPFTIFFRQLFDAERDDDALIRAVQEMYSFFIDYDFDRTFRSEAVWSALVEQAGAVFPGLADEHGLNRVEPSVGEISAVAQWIYHWFFPLSRELPEVDVAHATMGGICSLVCVVAQAEFGCGFLLSEHGIYLREAYLAEHGSRGSLFLKLFKLGFARRMTEIAYARAEIVAPCCDYNHRWERRIGVPPERIRTAYYGMDPEALKPAIRQRESDAAPIVAWAGRIDPLKDVETLLRAAAVALTIRPEIRFRLYGSAPPGNEDYLDRCLALHRELHLGDAVTFEGHAASTVEVFAEADLVVLSSISEGFPYSTLEAMFSGKPVVATSVGGIREQVAPSCGRIVRPRDPQALGEAVLEVLDDMDAYDSLARAARERAASLFTLDRFRSTHRDLYDEARALAAEPAPRASLNEIVAEPRRILPVAPVAEEVGPATELRVAAGGS